MTDLPFLELQGTAFERGLKHGLELKEAISENIETYLTRFAASGLSIDAARQEGETWIKRITGHNTSYAEEMKGVSEGSGLPLSDIAMLNARYEITFGLMGAEAASIDIKEEPEGCTTFGVLPEATKNGHTILGQNWDWLVGIYGHCVVMHVKRDMGPDFICYTEAGIVGGKMGVNQFGIGLVENGLVSNHDGCNAYEKPFHVRCREVLDAISFDMALLPILSSRRVCSANFMIGHADGEVINLETSPDAVSTHFPVDGLITHSNHFLDVRYLLDLHGFCQRLQPSLRRSIFTWCFRSRHDARYRLLPLQMVQTQRTGFPPLTIHRDGSDRWCLRRASGFWNPPNGQLRQSALVAHDLRHRRHHHRRSFRDLFLHSHRSSSHREVAHAGGEGSGYRSCQVRTCRND